MEKKGLSTVITTLITILLVLVAIGIIWVVIRGIIEKSSEQITINPLTNNFKIEEAKIGLLKTQIKLTRTQGNANLTSLKFILSDGVKTHTYEEKNPQLEELKTKTFEMPLEEIGEIKTLSIIPVFGKTNGLEIKKEISASDFDYSIEKNNGLVAYYKFENDAKDSSGNGNDGNKTGSVSFVQGKVGNAAALNGVGWVNISISSPTSFNEELTYIAWINLTTVGLAQLYAPIIDNGWWNGPYPRSWIYYTNNLNAMKVDTINSLSSGVSSTSDSGIQANTWYFVAASIKKNNKHSLYVNNNQYNSSISLPYSPGGTNKNIGIGAMVPEGQNKFNGTIDEVMIFNRSLTAQEIQQIYNSQK